MPSLLAILGLDGKGFQSGLNAAQLHANRAGSRIGSALTSRIASFLSAAAIASAVKHTIEWAGKLQDVSDALGVSVEWLQKMQNGAALAGGKIEDIEKSMIALTQAREDALRKPEGENAKALGRMGFSKQETAALPAQEFYDRMVKLFANGSSAQLENDVIQVGGKSAKNLLAAFANQFASDTPIVSEAMIEELDALGDRFQIFGQTLTANLAPAILFVMNTLMAWIRKLQELGSWLGAQTAETAKARQNRFDNSKELFERAKKFSERADITPEERARAKKLMELHKGIMSDANLLEPGGAAASEEEKRQKAAAEATEKARAERAARRKERRDRAPFDQDKIQLEDLKGGKQTNAPRMNLNALQQIGGFAAAPPGQAEMQSIAKGMAADVKRLVRNTEPANNGGVTY